MSAAGYSFDTNVFLDWWERRYPPAIFPAVQKRMEELAASGRLKAVQGVFEEIQHIGSPGLKAWAKTNKNLFVPHDRSIQQAAAAIHRQFPGFLDINATHDEADAYVIGLAQCQGLTVVTHETSARTKKRPPRSHYIPDVCRELNAKIRCIDLVEMMKAENWSF